MKARYICTFIAVVLFALPLAANAQRGAMVLHQNLAQLVQEADVIIRGQVVSAYTEPHPQFNNLYTVVVTLQVYETLKGKAGQTYTFRQFIWDPRDRFSVAGYSTKHHLLLLLNKPNKYGLSSPIGLAQGRFRIFADRGGRLYAANGAANFGLLRDVRNLLLRPRAKGGVRTPLSPRLSQVVIEHRAGPLPLEQLKGLIRILMRAQEKRP